MLLRRLLSATFLIALLISCAWLAKGKWFFITFIGSHLMVGYGLMEYFSMMKAKGLQVMSRYGTGAGLLLSASLFFSASCGKGDAQWDLLFLFILITVIFFSQGYRKDNGSPLVVSAVTLAGVMYVAWLFSFFYKILYFPGVDGRWFIFFAFLVTKSSDIMAYFVGSLLGRHPLAPQISPKKSIEGAVGGLAGAIGAAYLGKVLFFPETELPGLFVLGAVMGLVGIAGDLVESMLKRDATVKDSGRFIPGMGGVLDVLDSLLFTAPVMYFYMKFFL